MTERVRVGIIGTSWFTDLVHLPWLKSHPGAEVVAVCGRNPERASELAKKHGVPQVFSDYRTMIETGKLDAVLVVTPDNLHYEMTMHALEHKLHVLCEKPLASNATQAKEMYEKAESAGVKHMTFFTWRWMPHHQHMKQLVDSGYIGRPFDAHFRYVGGYARDSAYMWRFDRDVGSGALGDVGAHAIDFARYFVGEIRKVSCHLSSYINRASDQPYRPANDSAVLALEFVNGGHATMNLSAVTHMADRGEEQHVILHGEDGTLEALSEHGEVPQATLRGVRKGEEKFQNLKVPDELWGDADRNDLFDIFYKQPIGDRLFIDSILQDKPIQPSLYDGFKAQEVIDAALKSNETGQWVTLPG